MTQVLSCKFCEISKNILSYRTPLVAASVLFVDLCISWFGLLSLKLMKRYLKKRKRRI